MLRSSVNSEEVRREIEDLVADELEDVEDEARIVYEHGQWWVIAPGWDDREVLYSVVDVGHGGEVALALELVGEG